MKNLSIYIFSFICFIVFSCQRRQEQQINYEEDLYIPKYSSNFKINGDDSDDNILITVYNPWQGSKDISSQLLIERVPGSNLDTTVPILKGTAKRIICMSSTHVAMLDALGAADKIVGVSGIQYISNPYIIENADKIQDIGYEGNIDYETLLSLQPDIVLLFSVNGASEMEQKLREFKIPFLYVGDYVEEDPLGKVEWIIPIAEILGIREKGITEFSDIEKRYNSLKNKISQTNLEKPKVMLNAPFGDSWFMPSTESYVARMINDAGGEYLYQINSGNVSLPIDIEEAYKLVSEADYWLNTGTIKSMDEFKATLPKFSNADCVKKGKIFNNNFRTTSGGGNDCYESGVVNPDIVLRDIIKIFHPELVEEEFTYYHRLK